MASSQFSPQHQPQSQPQTPAPLPGYSDDEARDIYARASEIQSQSLFADDRLTPEQLERSANRAGISDAAVQQAIREREQERLQAVETSKQRAIQNARNARGSFVVATSVLLLVTGATLVSASKLGARNQAVLAAQSQVENVKQRRYDLVPNLIRVTQSTLKNQNALIGSLQTAADAAKNAAPEVQGKAQANLETTIKQTVEVLNREAGSSPVVLRLSDEMAGSENRIAVENRKLGQATQEYNRVAGGFPTRFFAKMFGYRTSYPYFQASQAAQQAPKFE